MNVGGKIFLQEQEKLCAPDESEFRATTSLLLEMTVT